MQHHHPGSKGSHGKSSEEVTFAAINPEFDPDDKIRTLLSEGPMEDLQDFRFYFTDKEEIEAVAAVDGTMCEQGQKIQTARTRRAWAAAKQNELGNGNHRTISSAASMRPTEQSQLPNLCEDALEALGYNLRGPPKHRCSRTDLPDVQEGTYDWDSYLAMLHTYLLALSIVDSNKIQGPQIEEALGNDPTEFVDIPWDVMQSYYYRADQDEALDDLVEEVTLSELNSPKALQHPYSALLRAH